MSTQKPPNVADINMGRRCLGELAATHVDIGDVGQGGVG